MRQWLGWLFALVVVSPQWMPSLAAQTETLEAKGATNVAKKEKKEKETRPKHVLAFYYGWYGNPRVTGRWVHWSDVNEKDKTIGSATHYPVLGPYDSHDPDVIKQHLKWAADSGITGLIASWWGQGTFEDQGIPLLLEAVQHSGLGITAYFETVRAQGNAPKPEDALRDVLYLLEKYGEHPAWLKVKGKPVLFVYGRAVGQIGLDGWAWVISETNRRYPGGAVFIGDRISQDAARVFDGIHTYNPTGQTAHKTSKEIRAWAQSAFPRWIETAGDRIACLTIIPGYDDSKLGRPKPRPITDRYDGETYRVLWEEAIAANPDWVLITSWNEWHEGSEIEPSVENRNAALKTTAEFAPKFKASPPR